MVFLVTAQSAAEVMVVLVVFSVVVFSAVVFLWHCGVWWCFCGGVVNVFDCTEPDYGGKLW